MIHCYALALAFVGLLAGCSQSSPGPQVAITAVRVDESAVPMPFVVAIVNGRGEPAEIRGVSVGVRDMTLIYSPRDAAKIPERFDCQVEHSPDRPTSVAAHSDGAACGFLCWKLPNDPPSALAVVACEFRVEVGDQTLTSEPITLVLQSRPGILPGEVDPMPSADGLWLKEQADRIVEVLSGLAGEKSPAARSLADRLKACEEVR